jgi:predicted AAA+ superfamily ATPase
MIDFPTIFELDRLARTQAQKYSKQRDLFNLLLNENGKHVTGIVGARGVGKTILLKQIVSVTQNSLYISADTIINEDLFEIAKNALEKYGIRCLCLDEIHCQPDYPSVLKKMYDFLDLRIIFTSSVSLALYASGADLSRRVRLHDLYPFSFKDYLYFKTGVTIPALSISEIVSKQWTPEHLRHEYLFDEYLQGGLMPFSLEEPEVLPLLRTIVQKVIGSDIPAVARLSVDELPLIQKCLEFIGKSSVDGINYSSLSRNIGITKYKAEAYVGLLEKAFILNPIFPKGANVLREPKVLMSLPYRLLYAGIETCIGGLREDFFAETMRMRALGFDYLKSTRGRKTPDFLIRTPTGDLVAEIGGKGKGRQQFKGIDAEKAIIFTHGQETDGIRRPLFLLGFC